MTKRKSLRRVIKTRTTSFQHYGPRVFARGQKPKVVIGLSARKVNKLSSWLLFPKLVISIFGSSTQLSKNLHKKHKAHSCKKRKFPEFFIFSILPKAQILTQKTFKKFKKFRFLKSLHFWKKIYCAPVCKGKSRL